MSDTEGFRYTTLGSDESALAGILDAENVLPEGSRGQWSIYFGTEDTDASLAQVVELGGEVVSAAEDTPYGRLATAVDPTGAVFKLMSTR
jgi:predicted enzyme related to lactoylglutathione lyase